MVLEENFPTPTVDEPSTELLEEWMYDGLGESTDGCPQIESDGECEHGYPSWLSYMESIGQDAHVDPASEVISNIASQGILGALCAILLLATWRLYTQVQLVQKSRVEDAQKVVETLMTIQREHTSTISSMTAVVSALKESVERLDRRGGE